MTNVPLSVGMLVMGEASHELGQRVHGGFLPVPSPHFCRAAQTALKNK